MANRDAGIRLRADAGSLAGKAGSAERAAAHSGRWMMPADWREAISEAG